MEARFKNKIIEDAILSDEKLNFALQYQKSVMNMPLWDVLIELGYITNNERIKLLSSVSDHPYVLLKNYYAVPEFNLDYLKALKEKESLCFKIDTDSKTYHMACPDPTDITLKDHLESLFLTENKSGKVILYHADREDILNKLDSLIPPIHNLCESRQHDAVAYLDHLLLNALQKNASDIHLQPSRSHYQISLRVDGMLVPYSIVQGEFWPLLCNRVKVLSDLDISEKRRPQNGSFNQEISGSKLDIRISCHPTVHGDSIVLRLLNKSRHPLRLSQLGFLNSHIKILKKLAERKEGLIIISGPTGSGKTTTLYSLLSEMDRQSRNIMTLEDPVEYTISNIRQTSIREGLISFEEGVKSILRQDPDVILVGEIRDKETAQMAIRSAMTGHLVLSTLHTIDTFSIPARLLELGVDPSLLSGHLLACLSQRLIKKTCIHCQGDGCKDCFYSGFKGRVVIAEILENDPDLEKLIIENPTRYAIKEHFCQKGFRGMAQDALLKIDEGVTNHQALHGLAL